MPQVFHLPKPGDQLKSADVLHWLRNSVRLIDGSGLIFADIWYLLAELPHAFAANHFLFLLLSHSITPTTRHLLLPRCSLLGEALSPPPPPARLRRTRASCPLRFSPSHSLREPPRTQEATCWPPTLRCSMHPPTAPLRNLHLTPAETLDKYGERAANTFTWSDWL